MILGVGKESEMKETDHAGSRLYSIGDVRQATGLTERRIRYYETQQLIAPQRTAGNQRMYSQKDLDRLLQIKRWLDEGFSLREVREKLRERTLAERRFDEDEEERDATAYFEGKRIARGGVPATPSLYPLQNRASIIRRIHHGDGPEKER